MKEKTMDFMSRIWVGLIVLVLLLVTFVIILIFFFNKKDPKAEVIIENNMLVIKTEDGEEYKKELMYPGFLEEVTLKSFEYIKINGETIISITINCTEVEERGNFDSFLVFLYEDSQFIKLLDGLDDRVFQYKNYTFNYLGDRKINITLPNTDFNVTLKNILTFEDPIINEDNEKDLISRMEQRSEEGYPILFRGLNNIEISNSEGIVKFSFSKFVYGFFHADIIGEIQYIYEYSDENKSLLQQITFKPDEYYELVD